MGRRYRLVQQYVFSLLPQDITLTSLPQVLTPTIFPED